MATHMSDDTLHDGGADIAGVEATDPEEFARLAAEVVALIEHHRDELREAMAELTALQRTLRSEVRDAIDLLRSAAGDAAAAAAADGHP